MGYPIARNDISPLHLHLIHEHSPIPLSNPDRLPQHRLIFLFIVQVRRVPHFPDDTVIFEDVCDFICGERLETDAGGGEGIVRWSEAGEFGSRVDRLPELCGPEGLNEGR
jgi:hypothetical protein